MKENKVLFIFAPVITKKDLQRQLNSENINMTEIFGQSTFPFGILSIQSYINKVCENFKSEILDIPVALRKKMLERDLRLGLKYIVDNYEDVVYGMIKEELENLKPDMVMISTPNDISVPSLHMISKYIKEYNSDILIIAGGNPVTNMHDEIMRKSEGNIDALGIGEGELPLSDLILSKDRRAFLESSKQFCTMKKVNLSKKYEYERVFVKNLDDIPRYDYKSYIDKYGVEILSHHSYNIDLSQSFDRQIALFTSMGCKYNCVFCSSSTVHGKKVRAFSLERIYDEIDFLVENYEFDSFAIHDDDLLFDVDRAIKICDHINKKKKNIRFSSGLVIAKINDDFVDCLVRNKVKNVNLALESGSTRMLNKVIKKPLTKDLASRVFNMFQNTDIFVRLYLVVGFRDEKIEDINETLDFLHGQPYSWVTISRLTPVSGSEVFYDTFKDDELENYKYEEASFFRNYYNNPDLEEKLNGDVKYTVNLDLNFVHNGLMKAGKYQEAKSKFIDLISLVDDHAFAYYYLAECQRKLGEEDIKSLNKYYEIINNSVYWMDYAKYFNLPTRIN